MGGPRSNLGGENGQFGFKNDLFEQPISMDHTSNMYGNSGRQDQ